MRTIHAACNKPNAAAVLGRLQLTYCLRPEHSISASQQKHVHSKCLIHVNHLLLLLISVFIYICKEQSGEMHFFCQMENKVSLLCLNTQKDIHIERYIFF